MVNRTYKLKFILLPGSKFVRQRVWTAIVAASFSTSKLQWMEAYITLSCEFSSITAYIWINSLLSSIIHPKFFTFYASRLDDSRCPCPCSASHPTPSAGEWRVPAHHTPALWAKKSVQQARRFRVIIVSLLLNFSGKSS